MVLELLLIWICLLLRTNKKKSRSHFILGMFWNFKDMQMFTVIPTDVFPLSYNYVNTTYLTDYFGEVLIPKVSRWETLAHVVLIRDDAQLIDSFFSQRTSRGWLEDLTRNRFVLTLPWRGVDLGGPWRGADLRGRAFWENRHWKFFFQDLFSQFPAAFIDVALADAQKFRTSFRGNFLVIDCLQYVNFRVEIDEITTALTILSAL